MTGQPNRPRSWEVTDGPQRAPARAMLRAVGFSEEDFGKPQVGVASSWNEVTPCNYHLDKLAALAKEGVRQGDAVPIEFTTIAVSDGIAMGHEGMKASLMSRDLIADSVELVMHAERLRRAGRDRRLRQVRARHADGDGAARPAGRLPLRRHDPAGHLPGARRHDPGRVRGRRRAREGHDRATTSCSALERAACPTTGSCAGMYTANTMACVGEALGMSLPGTRQPAGGRLPARGRGPRDRHRRDEGARARPPAAPDHDEGGVRERDRRGDGGRRLDERGAAPARDRARGARRPHARRLRPRVAPHPAPRRRPPGGQVRDERPRPRRRRARRDAGAARPRAAARRLPDRDRQDPGREPRRREAAGARRRRRASGRRRRSTRGAASRSCAATSRPTAR